MQYNLRAFGVWDYILGTFKCPSAASITLSSFSTSTATKSSNSSTSALTQDQWVHTDE